MASNSFYNNQAPQVQPGGYPPPPNMQDSYSGNGQMQYHDPNAYGGGEKGYQGQQPSYDYGQQQGPPVPHQQMMPGHGDPNQPYAGQPPYPGQPYPNQQDQDRGAGAAAAGAAGGVGCCACCATCLACCACCEVLDCIF